MTQPVSYEKYIRSARWRNISEAMKKYVGFVCARCKGKFNPAELDVHHLNYDRLGHERPSDLSVLCRRTCHPVADSIRVEARQERGRQRAHDTAKDTFLSRKYGDNYGAFHNPGMDDEFESWLERKQYGEHGE